jgi:hypothetical protein
MFCTTCGNLIAADQAVCSKCGRATAVGNMQGGVNRVSQHFRTLGILQIIYSGLHAIGGLCVIFVAKFVLGGMLGMANPRPPMFVQPLVEVIGWCLLGFSAIGLAGGIGLLSRAPWARTVALVAGFIELLNIPIGTALGIYTIWVLLSSGAEEEYRRMSFAHS